MAVWPMAMRPLGTSTRSRNCSPLTHQGLPLGDQAPLRDAGDDHLFDEIMAGLPVGLKAPLEKGFELHGGLFD